MKTICILFTILLGTVSCSDLNDPSLDNPRRSLSLTTKQAEFVATGRHFDFNLIKQTDRQVQDDWLISPFSMQCMLGMLLNGAQGETARQISEAIGYGDEETEAVNTYFQSVLQQLPLLDKVANIAIANAVFGRQDIPIKDPFKDKMRACFLAEIDNVQSGRALSKRVNAWCNSHTNGMISNIFRQEDNNIAIIILSALYFKSQWVCSFPKSSTKEELFYPDSGAQHKVAMMKLEGSFLLGEQDNYRIINLPYGNGAFSMYILLPQIGKNVHSVIQELDAVSFDRACAAMRQSKVGLWLPRFERSGDEGMSFNKILSDMGMPLITDGGDFKLISDALEAFSLIQQNTAISVTEDGTEAAAVTQAIGLGLSNYETFHADHPFLYLIRENSSGIILFAGCFNG